MASGAPHEKSPGGSGLIILNKPVGITSARALDRVRRITGIRKSGHAGTLDPNADGVLLICCGRATKLVEQMMDLPKVYRATARLDVTSDSFDTELPTRAVEARKVPDAAAVAAAARQFEGRITQVPPLYSAVKIGGRPAYKLARADRKRRRHADAGNPADRLPPKLEPRLVHVYALRVEAYQWPELTFELVCGRGTYVRALIRDWGAALGVGGCLTALTRTAIGPFRLEAAHTLGQLGRLAVNEAVIPLNRLVEMIADRPPAADPPPGQRRGH